MIPHAAPTIKTIANNPKAVHVLFLILVIALFAWVSFTVGIALNNRATTTTPITKVAAKTTNPVTSILALISFLFSIFFFSLYESLKRTREIFLSHHRRSVVLNETPIKHYCYQTCVYDDDCADELCW